MSHSKRNTSLAFFTSHERALLRGTWGSQSARLSSASVLPFGHCTLCLLPAVDPVACSGFTAVISANDETSKAGEKRKRPICSKTHIFCRGCALENILAQKKEIKRLEKVEEAHRLDAEEQQFAQDQIRQEKELRTFEAAQSGLSGNGAVQVGDKGTKRKRLDNDEKDADKKGRSSFWIPSETPDAGLHLNSKIRKQEKKLAPICPGSAGEDVPHGFSLKVLTPVVFSEEARQKDSKEEGNTRVCPACNKPLSNSSKATLARPCGHVACGSCTKKFVLGGTDDGGEDVLVGERKIACFVCGEDLVEHERNAKEKESKKDKGKPAKGLAEISCEGTGYAGGGKNMVKREGVSFQC